MTDHHPGPEITPLNPLLERATRSITGEGRGRAIGQLLGRTFGGQQLRRLRRTDGEIPWTPLRRPLTDATVALVSTSGVHLRSDPPFALSSDASYRVIPGEVEAAELQLTHRGYDRRDAALDINLVFPLPRLRELAAAGVIGRVAGEHFGFGLTVDGSELSAPGEEVAMRLAGAGVDLALLVPA